MVAVVIGVLAGVPASPPVRQSDTDVLRFARIDLATVGTTAVGIADLGELGDPARRAACLVTVGLTPDTTVLGGRRVLMDGRAGVLLVLGTGQLGQLRLVVVDPACGPDGGTLLAGTTVGRR